MDKVLKWLKESARKYAKVNGYKLNPDSKVVDTVIKGLIRNKEKHHYLFCPCRVVTGDMKKDRPKICPCIWHKAEIKEDGHCKCGLFVSKGYGED